jgi:hypothetical protein
MFHEKPKADAHKFARRLERREMAALIDEDQFGIPNVVVQITGMGRQGGAIQRSAGDQGWNSDFVQTTPDIVVPARLGVTGGPFRRRRMEVVRSAPTNFINAVLMSI